MNSTDIDDKVVGISYIIASLLTVTLYVPCLTVMHRSPDLNKLSCPRIMFQLGVFDLVHTSSATICGAWSMTGYAHYVPHWLNKIVLGLTGIFGWNGYLLSMTVLAFDRSVSLAASQKWKKLLFSYEATTNWIRFCWFYATLWLVFNLSPLAGLVYYPDIWVWYFDSTGTLTHLNEEAVFWTCVALQVITWICNAISIASVNRLGQNISAESRQRQEARKRERNLLIQTLLICAPLLVADQYWHNISDWVCPHLGPYCYAVGVHLLLLNSFTTALVYLVFNRTISHNVKALFSKSEEVSLTLLAPAVRFSRNGSSRSKERNYDLVV